MDALTVVLGAGIGVVAVAIVGIVVALARRGRVATDDLWQPEAQAAPDAALAPYWQREAPEAVRPLPPSTTKVALDPAERAALIEWQDAQGELLDVWLDRHEARLRDLAAADDRAAAYQSVLRSMSAAEERVVHEAIDRTPDAELREHLLAMHKAAVDALVHAAKGDVAASSASYAAYLRHRALSEARMEALEPAAG